MDVYRIGSYHAIANFFSKRCLDKNVVVEMFWKIIWMVLYEHLRLVGDFCTVTFRLVVTV